MNVEPMDRGARSYSGFGAPGFGMLLVTLLFLVSPGYGQLPVSEIRLATEPEDRRIRPLESATVQVIAYAKIVEDGETRKVRVQQEGARFRLTRQNSGALSQPFRYQGDDEEPFYQEASAGLGQILLGQAFGDFVLKDTVLYSAPRRPGKYEIEVSLDGKTLRTTITVDPQAPSRRKKEVVSFRPEGNGNQPLRALAERYAPLIAQETWFEPKSDYIARFDFDGDWRGDNNWDQTDEGSSQAYVYYAAMETRTHWFLVYDIFHPRDYSDKCVAGTCHENDSEGLVLTIEKDGSRYGRLLAMETLAHNNIYSYRADRSIRSNVHNVDGEIEFYDSRPVVFVESGGHGVYGSVGRHSRYDPEQDEFLGGTGVTYIFKGKAERPEHPDDRLVGYQLLPAFEHLWLRGNEQRRDYDRLFDDYFRYQPYGGRPTPRYSEISGAFLGRKKGRNKAKPFWGWHDRRTDSKKILAPGQWALDPAYSVSQNLSIPGSFSLVYQFNPYLGIGKSSASTATDRPEQPSRPAESRPPESAPREPTTEVELLSGAGSLWSEDREYEEGETGTLEFEGRIDDWVVLHIRQDRIFARVLAGGPVRDQRFTFSQPIPEEDLRRITLRQESGRGEVVLLGRPWEGNGYIAIVRVSDPRGGDDLYRFRLEWEK